MSNAPTCSKPTFFVSLTERDVRVEIYSNMFRSEARGDHLESQVQQMKAKLLSDFYEANRLMELLNLVPVIEARLDSVTPPKVEQSKQFGKK